MKHLSITVPRNSYSKYTNSFILMHPLIEIVLEWNKNSREKFDKIFGYRGQMFDENTVSLQLAMRSKIAEEIQDSCTLFNQLSAKERKIDFSVLKSPLIRTKELDRLIKKFGPKK